MEKSGFKGYISQRVRDRGFVGVICVYLTLCLASAVFWCVCADVRNVMMSILYMLFVPLALIVEHIFKLRISAPLAGAIFFIAVGSILGSAFDFYTIIPFFDTLLHGLSGVLFASVGFAIAEFFFSARRGEGGRHFLGCLLFAILFSLSVAVVWELIEYSLTLLLGFDMMEDSYVTEINSYLLSGTHNATVYLPEITKTVIHYGNGEVYEIVGAYVDIGLIDTLSDMAVCTAGTAVFAVVAAIGRRNKKFLDAIVPRVLTDTLGTCFL